MALNVPQIIFQSLFFKPLGSDRDGASNLSPCAYLSDRHISVTNNLPHLKGGLLQLDGERQ